MYEEDTGSGSIDMMGIGQVLALVGLHPRFQARAATKGQQRGTRQQQKALRFS